MKLYGITQAKKKSVQSFRRKLLPKFLFFIFCDKLDQSYWEHFSNGQENSLF